MHDKHGKRKSGREEVRTSPASPLRPSLRSRRGDIGISADWAIALAITFMAMFGLFITVAIFKQRHVDMSDVNPQLYLSKLYYSPKILTAVDTRTQTPQYGTIDASRITDAELAKNNVYGAERIAAKITLYDTDGEVVASAKQNPSLYAMLQPFAVTSVTGAGGANRKVYTFATLYVNGQKEDGTSGKDGTSGDEGRSGESWEERVAPKNGFLEIEIIQSNS